MDRDALLAQLRERIVAYAASRGAGDAAHDVAQDVLLLLHEKYGHVTAPEDLVPLSLQIARTKLWDRHKKAIRRGEYNPVPIEEANLVDPADGPGRETERRQLLDRLTAALGRLGERCRRLFRWKLEGKTFPEIQRLLEAPSINTVYTWDHRCRKELLGLMGGSWE